MATIITDSYKPFHYMFTPNKFIINGKNYHASIPMNTYTFVLLKVKNKDSEDINSSSEGQISNMVFHLIDKSRNTNSLETKKTDIINYFNTLSSDAKISDEVKTQLGTMSVMLLYDFYEKPTERGGGAKNPAENIFANALPRSVCIEDVVNICF